MLAQISLIALASNLGSLIIPASELESTFSLAAGDVGKKTGVTNLFRLSASESLEQLTVKSALKALRIAGLTVKDLRGVFGSSNPTTNTLMPSYTVKVAQMLGCESIIVDHVGMGCGGALQAMRNAYNQLVVDSLMGITSNYLIIVGDHTSRILDPAKYDTGILFSEGTAAAVITNDRHRTPGYVIARVGTMSLLGENLESLKIENPYSFAVPRHCYFEMDGRRVFEFGTKQVPKFLELVGLKSFPENAYLVPHQPNLRMLEKMAKDAQIDPKNIYMEGIRTIGNTSTPAVFIGLEDALQRGLMSLGAPVLLGTFGAELQVGAAWLLPVSALSVIGQ